MYVQNVWGSLEDVTIGKVRKAPLAINFATVAETLIFSPE